VALGQIHAAGNNEGSRQRRRARLPQMSTALIRELGVEIARALMPGSYCARFCDKFTLCEGLASFDGLRVVDLICWDSGTFGMGWRTRQRGQYVVILQKEPTRTRATKGLLRPWRAAPGIADVWPEKIPNPRHPDTHPHAKPIRLLTALIEATPLVGDVVVDPAAGSFAASAAK
jgi:site-specific DNA-methyltransferase (adenine-specific)